ncbi:amino acid ABC transporter permease [Nocardioides bigeumensis]|jgi:glutamate transport system permease protein|uniref:amino acid ABC transporter permease n=1 Tax=Nocardioides bigeumensis TaxID=433657 RepID=UPI0031DB7280
MTSLLFDVPGPRTRARHRIYSVAAWLLVAAIVAAAVWRMQTEGQLDYDKWEPLLTPEYIRVILVDGLLNTLRMAALAVLFALAFGIVFGIGKLSDHRWVRIPCWLVVEFFRAVPLLLLIIFIFYRFGIGDGIGAYWSVVIGLTLYNGSVLAEIFRAGVLAVPKGQSEAAYAIGMRKTQVMATVLLPQAVKIMIPAIISQCVVALKDTSLGYYIGAPGLTAIGKPIYVEFKNQVQMAIAIAALYIVANLVLSYLANLAQRRFVGERRKPLDVSMAGRTDRDTGIFKGGS